MPGVSFQFSAKDNSTKVFKSFNKSINDLNKNIKNVQKTLKSLSNIFSMTFGVIGRVVSSVVNMAVNIIKKGLSTIKNLITGAFNFIKSALTTLLGWMKKALGTVFDWIGKTVTTISKTAVNTAKKAISGIVKSIQSYADKEYNSIQLKVSLGSDYSKVQKSFDELVRMTTADRNDLWSVFATYAEVGKTADEISKYARATVYLANATGLSLDRITRIFLAQEAVTKNVEKTLYKYGINIKNAKADLSDIEKIIVTMDKEMQALASDSLSQTFANVKNDLIAIKEGLGSLFAGPVKYVADKLDKLLQKILGSNKIESLATKLDALFDKIKPVIDDIFDFVEKVIADPTGFLDALWKDIQAIFANIRANFGAYINVLAFVLGSLLGKVIDAIRDINWLDVTEAFNNLASSLGSFVVKFGVGAGWFDPDDVEKPLREAFINAWNKAHEEVFQLSADNKWYDNLVKIFQGLWSDISGPIEDWWNQKWPGVKSYLTSFFTYLADLFGTLIYNTIVDSPLIDLLNKIPGVNIGKPSDLAKYQESIYAGLKALSLLDEFGLTDARQITREWLNLKPDTNAGGNVATNYEAIKNIMAVQNKAGSGFGIPGFSTIGRQFEQEFADALNAVKNLDNIWETKTLPLLSDYLPKAEEATDKTTEAAEKAGEAADKTTEAAERVIDVTDAMEEELKRRREQIESSRFNLNLAGPVLGGNSFQLPGFANGGLVTKPTVALIGEAGPELVIPWKGMPKLANADAESYGIGSNVEMTMVKSDHWLISFLKSIDANTEGLDKLLDSIGRPILEGVTNISDWCNKAEGLPEVTKEIESYCKSEDTLIDRIWKGAKTVWKTITDKSWWKNLIEEVGYFFNDAWNELGKIWSLFKGITWNDIKLILSGVIEGAGKALGWSAKVSGKAIGWLAQNGAFGSHIGNITSGIMQQQENGTLSIWTALGEIIKEFLPYLQQGLELVGGIFDKAFEILANAVMKLGEEISTTLLPLLESFIPFMKVLADIVTALAPVVSSVLAPALYVICAVLQALTGLLDMLMPAFAGIGAVIQWVSDAISWAIGSFINWLASWIPWIDGVGEVHRPDSIRGYYNSIMGAYNDAKNTGVNASMASAQTASQTVSYSGATHITINNDFAGSYIVGSDGMSELALIMANQLDNMGYLKVNIV